MKALDLWHGNRAVAELVLTIDVGNLSSWRFNDMSTMTRWVSYLVTTITQCYLDLHQVSSDSVDEVKFEMGPAKRALTKEEAAALGAGTFSMRVHAFITARDKAKIFLNMIPGTSATLPPEVIAYNGQESFPVVSYALKDKENKESTAEIFPPADPVARYGVHSLGLVNSLAIPVDETDGEGTEVKIDPGQLVRCTR